MTARPATRKTRFLLLGCALSAMATQVPSALAADWISPVGGNWSDASNWNPAEVPSNSAQATFNLGNSYVVSVPAAVAVGAVQVEGGTVGLNLAGAFQTYGLNVDSADLSVVGGVSNIGDLASQFPSGSFRVNKATLQFNSVVNSNLDLNIGDQPGTSRVNFVGSDVVSGLSRVLVGSIPGADATLQVDGLNTRVKTKGAVIGNGGNGLALVTNGGRLDGSQLNGAAGMTIGANGGTGQITVDGNVSLMQVANTIVIGDGVGSRGTLLVTNSGRARLQYGLRNTPGVMIGANGGQGQLHLTGDDSNLRIDGSLFVNHNNTTGSSILVEPGAFVRAEHFTLNSTVAGDAVVVSGETSSMDVLGKAELNSGTIRVAGGQFSASEALVFNTADARVNFDAGAMNIGDLVMGPGQLNLAAGGDKVLRAQRVIFKTDPGTIDLADNAMIVDYDADVASPLTRLVADIDSGSRTPSGYIRSSAAAANPERYALGTIEAVDLPPPAPGSGRTFGREAVDDTAVVVKFTLRGDANLDQVVNLADLSLLAAGFNQPDGRWYLGDFNYDGQVGLTDFSLMAANFGQSIGAASRGSAVPEPSTLAVVGAGVAAMLRRRRA